MNHPQHLIEDQSSKIETPIVQLSFDPEMKLRDKNFNQFDETIESKHQFGIDIHRPS
jgi:hypothetical protein